MEQSGRPQHQGQFRELGGLYGQQPPDPDPVAVAVGLVTQGGLDEDQPEHGGQPHGGRELPQRLGVHPADGDHQEQPDDQEDELADHVVVGGFALEERDHRRRRQHHHLSDCREDDRGEDDEVMIRHRGPGQRTHHVAGRPSGGGRFGHWRA